jgi:hypothetical protein
MIKGNRSKALLYSSPEMKGETYKYWLRMSGLQFGLLQLFPIAFLFLYPINLFFFPVFVWVFIAAMKDASLIARSWIPNINRFGCEHLKWDSQNSMENAYEEIASFIRNDRRIVSWGVSETKRKIIVVALISGGRDSLGYTKFYAILRGDRDATVIDVYTYKRFISPLEALRAPVIDSMSKALLSELGDFLKEEVRAIKDAHPSEYRPHKHRLGAEDKPSSSSRIGPRDKLNKDLLDTIYWNCVAFFYPKELRHPTQIRLISERVYARMLMRFLAGTVIYGLIAIVIARFLGYH